ncbi:MAG: hypothetical protein SFW08_03555 [Gemmatimonadaceae bacterium]|nr:hypothetical protein [Gemmatimonadaceae bacterium]
MAALTVSGAGRWHRRLASSGLVLVLGAAWGSADAQPSTARVRDPGPGVPGRVVQQALRGPHRVVEAKNRWAVIPHGDDTQGSLIIVNGSARLNAVVTGDVIVVDGDLRLQNGARIGGRVVVLGGHLFNWTPFSVIRGDVIEQPNDRFDAALRDGVWQLSWGPIGSQYPVPGLRMPGLAGFDLRAYSRVDGLALQWGPEVNAGRSLRVRPAATWRTHRGVIDPSLSIRAGSRRVWLDAVAERTTASNDMWLTGDRRAAVLGFLTGLDARDWYRADRAEGILHLLRDGGPMVVEVRGGVRSERASAASLAGPLSPPWHFGADNTAGGFARPNPAVSPRTLSTVLAGVNVQASGLGIDLTFDVAGEREVSQAVGALPFTQIVATGRAAVPLVAGARFEAFGRAVETTQGSASHRLAAVGGAGTLLTEPTLALRGTALRYGEVRLALPSPLAALPVRIAPRLAFGRTELGAAARSVTNYGVQFDVGPLRLEYAYDPSARRGVTQLTTTWIPAVR